MAIASLVCSLASPLCCSVLSLVGIILGVVALNQIKQTGEQGRGLALAGIIIGVALVVLTAIALVVYVAFYASMTSGY